MDAIGFSAMNVEQMLAQCADFPQPGHPPKKVGERWYPRSASDSVPALVRAGVDVLKTKLANKGALLADNPKAKRAALNRLIREVWPKPHRSSETSRKQAAEYVRDWAAERNITVKLPANQEG